MPRFRALVLFALMAPALDSAAGIVHGPWLQHVTADGARVLWEADREISPAPRVEYGTDPQALDSSAVAELAWVEGVPVYTARLDGLPAGRQIFYRVEDPDDAGYAADLWTAPADARAGFRFYLVGDNRSNPGTWGLVADRILADARQLPAHNQTFVINTGDLVADGSVYEDWDQLWPPARELLARMTLVVGFGNHEDRNTAASDAYLEAFFDTPEVAPGAGDEKWFGWSWAGVHITAAAIYDQAGYSQGPQAEWLAADLAAAAADERVSWLFGLIHFLPWSLGDHGYDDAAGLRQALHPLLAANGVTAAFGGHNHLYARYAPVDGVTYLTTGGAGADLHTDWYDPWPGADFVTSYQQFNWCLVDVEPDAVALRVLDLDGAVVDWVTFGKQPGDLPPFADAGADQLATVGDRVVLDGTGSADPEAAGLTYRWSQLAGPPVELLDAHAALAAFEPAWGGRYLFELRVSDGTTWSPPDFCEVRVTAGSATITPVADTYVDASRPSENFGAEPVLLLDTDPDVYHSYLRFEVAGSQGPILRARLRLYCSDTGDTGLVRVGSDVSWAEDWPTWDNRLAEDGAILGGLTAVAGEWSELDVTEALSSDGPVTFVLLPGGSNGADFDSRQGARPPELIVDWAGDAPVEPDGGTDGWADGGTDAGIDGGADGGVDAGADQASGPDAGDDGSAGGDRLEGGPVGGCGCGGEGGRAGWPALLVICLILIRKERT